MVALLCSEKTAIQWLKKLAETSPVLFPQRASDGAYHFKKLRAGSEIVFDGYRPSQLPPGKTLAPARDVLLSFEGCENGSFVAKPVLDRSPRVLAGVRPCDLRAIALMDTVNGDAPADENYLVRRQHTRIIGWACATPCDDRCFCQSVGSLDSTNGADVMLVPTEDGLLAEARTQQGEAMLEGLDGRPCHDPEAVWQAYRDRRPEPFGRQLNASVTEVRAALKPSWDNSAWDKHAEKCLACGTCNLVCPTCYCFDTFDEVDVGEPGRGQRCRTWDGCMLPEFATVAAGHDFRSDLASRHRHRIKRKFEYLSERFEEGSFCVGCGRCGTQCTVAIDIFDMANDVLEGVKP